jgi:hypothetical protein
MQRKASATCQQSGVSGRNPYGHPARGLSLFSWKSARQRSAKAAKLLQNQHKRGEPGPATGNTDTSPHRDENPQAARGAVRSRRLDDRQFAISTRRGRTIRRAIQTFVKVHQRQKGRQHSLLVFVRQTQPAIRDDRKFVRGRLDPVGNFGLARRRGFAYRNFAPQFRTVMLDCCQEVLDTKDFCFKLLRNGNLAPAQAGRTGHRGRHTPTLYPLQ